MEVKEIFLVLSKDSEDITYSSLIYETRAEKIALICFLGFFLLYIALIALEYIAAALLFAVLAITALFSYSIASFISSKDFIVNPVKLHVENIHRQIDAEEVLTGQLSNYSTESLSEAKSISERRNTRIKNHISFMLGAIDKVGIFPTLLALFYAIREYQNASESSLLVFIILGLILGLYSSLLLLKRILNWQENCIALLDKAINAGQSKVNSN